MTLWFDRKAGNPLSVGCDEDRGGDPNSLLLLDGAPDWIRTPPGMQGVTAGQELRVTGVSASECPMCGNAAGLVRHLRTASGLGVAECSHHGFVWYRARS